MTASVSDINDARSPLSYALRYVALGLWVLPLEPGTKKPLGRLVRNGFHDATNDPDKVRTWWAQHADAGVGIAVKKSGWVVVDIDPRNGGIDTIDAIEARHGPLQSDVLAYTGGGGEHRVFAAELVEALPGKLGPGVDLKADGYVCVEPTFADKATPPHHKAYAWEASSDPLDGVVDSNHQGWNLENGRGPAQQLQPYAAPPIKPIEPRRLASAQEALAVIASDEREVWVKVGAAIHNELPTQEGFSLWDAWSRGSSKYDAQDAIRVWRSLKVKGLAGVGLNTVFAMAQAQGWKNTGGPISQPAEPTQPVRAAAPLLDLQQLEKAAGNITWLIKHIVPADSVGVMFGASGTFKSFIALDMALHVAHGMNWLGKKTRRGCVIFIAAEGGAGLWRRIKAWHAARGLKPGAIAFYVVPAAVVLGKNAATIVEAARAAGVEPDLVVVDTMSQTFDGEENSANDVAAYFRELGDKFRALWRCAVFVIHHSGHSATERPRGSSAILSNVDFLFGVFRDEKQLLATLSCDKQKDGERPDAAQFELTSHVLGRDEDDEEVRSLAACHLDSAEALVEAHRREAGAGRGGRNALLMGLVHAGMTERELRHGFYEAIGEVKDVDAKKIAFYRARDWAVQQKYIELGPDPAGGPRRVILLKEYP